MSNSLKLIVEDVDVNSFEYLVEEKNTESDPKFYIKGPMIMLDEKNQNGRIYEAGEMNPAVEKYIKEYVETGRALGEMEHPSCSLSSSDILTDDGWKSIVDVKVGDIIPTLNTSTGVIELHAVNKKIDQPYKGKMYTLKGRNINITVTPNHRFPIVDRYGNTELVHVEDIYLNRKKYNKSYIPKLGQWNSDKDSDKFVLKGVNVDNINLYKNDVTKDIEIDYSVFMSFMGIWLSEGHLLNKDNRQYGGSTVCITQRKKHNIELIRDMLSKFPNELEWKENISNNGTVLFFLSDVRLFKYLSKLGDCYNKYIPKELKELDPELLNDLLFWFNIGDGRAYTSDDRGYITQNIFSTSKRLIDDLHEILLKSGGSGNIRTIVPTDKDYIFCDHIISSKDKSNLYQLNLSKTRGIYLDERFLNIIETEVDENVYCVTVPNETFYIRENGKSCWSGNCPDVNLERACDRMVSLVKEGNCWVGKAVCLSTPMGKLQESLIRDGVKLGKSTRCLGQLMENNGVNYVKSPNIRAIDTVHNPSGQGKDTSCFMNGILENKEFIINYDNGYEEIYDGFEKTIGNLPKKQVDAYLTEAILDFISKIR